MKRIVVKLSGMPFDPTYEIDDSLPGGIILSSRDTMALRVRPCCSAITARSAPARTAATSSSSSFRVHRAPGEASGASPAPLAADPVVTHG